MTRSLLILGGALVLIGDAIMAGEPWDSYGAKRASDVAHRISEQRVEVKDLLDYLRLQIWKYEVHVEDPFKGYVTRIVHYRRNGEDGFSSKVLVKAAAIHSQPSKVRPVTIIFDGQTFTLDGIYRSSRIGGPLADYRTWSGGNGRKIGKEQVLMAKASEGVEGGLIRAKNDMDAYIAVEIEFLYEKEKQIPKGQQ